ncbi:MAG: hypothetical protein IJ480_01835 [Clostridia bacterium]|nr:hypothetical protein [Clostridia bacterium]
MSIIPREYALETWNRKRIGIGVADSVDGIFVRHDTPLLEPRDCSFWDCTITTNPSVAILPDGTTYMIYKSRQSIGKPLQLGTLWQTDRTGNSAAFPTSQSCSLETRITT